jgi:hypothetical protein
VYQCRACTPGAHVSVFPETAYGCFVSDWKRLFLQLVAPAVCGRVYLGSLSAARGLGPFIRFCESVDNFVTQINPPLLSLLRIAYKSARPATIYKLLPIYHFTVNRDTKEVQGPGPGGG